MIDMSNITMQKDGGELGLWTDYPGMRITLGTVLLQQVQTINFTEWSRNGLGT
jgi:hypothetical protein